MLKKTTLERLGAMFSQAQMNAQNNTDEQAVGVPSLYPTWESFDEGITLKNGLRVNYNGVLYKVITEHQKQQTWNPADAPSLFAKVLIENPNVIPEWEQPDSTNPYQKGDKVIHNGITYESLVAGNVWEPGAVGTESLWVAV
jgi:hypothetical protein